MSIPPDELDSVAKEVEAARQVAAIIAAGPDRIEAALELDQKLRDDCELMFIGLGNPTYAPSWPAVARMHYAMQRMGEA